jgi:hypothetical protein
VARTIAEKEIKLLFAQSGGICAFPGCDRPLIEAGTSKDPAAVLGEIAHIVADSRAGPRGLFPITEEDVNAHGNLILLCGDHHKLVDSQPNTFSVAVLREMKAQHIARIQHALGKSPAKATFELRHETMPSTLLAVTHLPEAVFTAPSDFRDDEQDKARQVIKYPKDRSELLPFLLREGKLFAFHDLRRPGNPFAACVRSGKVEVLPATEMWRDAEGKRRYVTLLNRAMFKYTGHRGVRYLPTLGRYPHGHVPSPLQIADHVGDTPKPQLLKEIMVLTKMNWNSANLSGLMPITLRFARLVGDILREVPAHHEPQSKYKYYM